MAREADNRVLWELKLKVRQLSVAMEKMRLAEYVALLDRPYRLLYINFLTGIARGLGIAVGFTILGAVVVLVLQRLVTLNLPLIGGFIADIVRAVEINLAR
ncbi:DUF5665 domain-containing protein [Candidatus Desulforudis audaxviator]|uniref:Uncharacterized protein n=1 Tax=Desulforudis audaxviator (strain MP104C) TaxID=477974 RepID=B1I4K1_DESAP|nr:DUF5665 domain-containing protein [Candidatus Desulforudis audaxviator]ACA59861.1 conserved hypothetical protein [Candidatus Desulforudis audaxviator MP104C]AZK59866.1 hypothetical protein Daudx_1319 [Candidatus Desulforudis audaxviator]